jgi:hypothetical protein
VNLSPDSRMTDYSADDALQRNSDDHMRGQVEIRNAVHEELEDFWKRLARRLDTISDNGGQPTRDSIAEVKGDIRTAIAEHFGKPVARTLRSIKRGSSNWNEFCSDAYRQHRAEQERDELPGNTIPVYALIVVMPYAQFVKTCSQEWKLLETDAKTNYRSSSSPMRLSNVIGSDEQSKRHRRKRLIDNIKNAVWWLIH